MIMEGKQMSDRDISVEIIGSLSRSTPRIGMPAPILMPHLIDRLIRLQPTAFCAPWRTADQWVKERDGNRFI